MNIESRINRIENKLRPGKEFVVPEVRIVTEFDPNDEEKDVIYIGGPTNRRRNNGQKTIETD